MLETENVSVFYGRHHALEKASIKVDRGEIVVMLGANGAGKSTFLRAIAGVTPAMEGSVVRMDGDDITHRPPYEIVEAGIALVPEDRGIFADLTVEENLFLGANPKRARAYEAENLDKVFSLFPKLAERRTQAVHTMSGGERQMVAIGRAMMSHPTILMLDEPSLGLSPLLSKELFQSLTVIKDTGVGIFLVEQNAKQSLAIADRGYLLDNGHITGADTAHALANDQQVIKAYLGGAEAKATTGAPAAFPTEDRAAGIDSPHAITAGNRAGLRQRTNDIIPFSISELVDGASAVQSAHFNSGRVEGVGAPPPPTNGGSHKSQPSAPLDTGSSVGRSSELQQMLAEMEAAAANALNPRGGETS
ncbi:MAG: ABC transporter ATP-binding protein [Rhodospirillales bacterium]|nr:ABC transporter ATP-binding protein [Rhodospirillales bacterium]